MGSLLGPRLFCFSGTESWQPLTQNPALTGSIDASQMPEPATPAHGVHQESAPLTVYKTELTEVR